jgi:S-methylmethionine-dependent homocysteine/selenocysteine methylase
LWGQYIKIAGKYNLPFLAATPTRRANRERVQKAGLDRTIIYDNVNFLQQLKQESCIEMYAGGLMGCRGDAYTGEGAMTENDSHEFHGWQANCFKEAGADFLYAGIMPTLPEAKGMAKAMSDTALPYIISLTIQKDVC